MKQSRIIASALGVGLAAGILVGCSQPAHSDGPFFREIFQIDSDGRTVRCFYKEIGSGYGTNPAMSCDWATAVVHPPKP